MKLNDVIVMGCLGDDARVHKNVNGKEFMTFSLAVSNGKDKNGKELAPSWISCISWKTSILKYLKKGKRIIVKGSLSSYEKNIDEKKHSFMNVVASEFVFISKMENNEVEDNDFSNMDFTNDLSAPF